MSAADSAGLPCTGVSVFLRGTKWCKVDEAPRILHALNKRASMRLHILNSCAPEINLNLISRCSIKKPLRLLTARQALDSDMRRLGTWVPGAQHPPPEGAPKSGAGPGPRPRFISGAPRPAGAPSLLPPPKPGSPAPWHGNSNSPRGKWGIRRAAGTVADNLNTGRTLAGRELTEGPVVQLRFGTLAAPDSRHTGGTRLGRALLCTLLQIRQSDDTLLRSTGSHHPGNRSGILTRALCV